MLWISFGRNFRTTPNFDKYKFVIMN
jgi:hypothetical protein